MREADVAIRLRQPTQPDLIQRKLFTVHIHLYAAPAYLEQFGRPADARRSRQPPHRHLRRAGAAISQRTSTGWRSLGRDPDNPRIPILQDQQPPVDQERRSPAASASPCCPDYMVEQGLGAGAAALPEAEVPSFSTYFVYPAELKNSARVHVFRDFFITKAQNWSY